MINAKKINFFKTITVMTTALVLSQTSNAFFFDKENDRELRTTPTGAVVPVRKEGWLDRATTYHEELKPVYNPETQRVQAPVINGYNGERINTGTSTVNPSWYDNITTYHEEDRRPWNPYTEDTKKIPAYMYYDRDDAAEGNKHYNQSGLKPVPYMYGSASLVLRKERQIEELNTEYVDGLKAIEANSKDADSRVIGMENIYIKPLGGYETIDARSLHNNRNSAKKDYFISMAEPIDREKTVSKNQQWQEKLKSANSFARPGDFDYQSSKPEDTRVSAYSNSNSNYGFAETTEIEPSYMQENNMAQGDMVDRGQVIATTGNTAEIAELNSYGEQKVTDYTVEQGDTLSEISDKEKIYGDWTLWPLIYDANRTQVKDPDLITPGQNLDIPRGYNTADENDARYRANTKDTPISLYDNR